MTTDDIAPQEPTTEAGRALDRWAQSQGRPTSAERIRKGILAIEAEARATLTASLRIALDAAEAAGRADALREAAERVRGLRYNEPQIGMDEEMRQHNQILDAVLAILNPEATR